MAHITGWLSITAPIEKVFDTIADSRNEPRFNPSMTSVELLTPEPVGLGTRFRAFMGNRGLVMLVELTGFQRPHLISSRTTSAVMDTSGTLTFTTDGESTIMAWDWQVHPRGWLRVLGPVFGPLGARMKRRIWTGLKRMLEEGSD